HEYKMRRSIESVRVSTTPHDAITAAYASRSFFAWAQVLFMSSTFLSPLLAARSEARIWRVHPNGTGDAPTIQTAIHSSVARATVLVGAGTYRWTSQGGGGPSMGRMKAGIVLLGGGGRTVTLPDAGPQG